MTNLGEKQIVNHPAVDCHDAARIRTIDGKRWSVDGRVTHFPPATVNNGWRAVSTVWNCSSTCVENQLLPQEAQETGLT